MSESQPERGLLATVLFEDFLVGIAAINDARLGYLIAPEAWRRGFATEACQALLDHGFATTDWPEIHARIQQDNLASLRVLDKLGFQVTRESLGYSRAQGRRVRRLDLTLSRHGQTSCGLGSEAHP